MSISFFFSLCFLLLLIHQKHMVDTAHCIEQFNITRCIKKIVLIQQSHIGTKKTYESTEPQLGLLKTSPTEELEV